MPRQRVQLDLNSPLAREREGVKLTERSLSSRLAEIIERLERVTEAAMPELPEEAWSLVLWAGWFAIESERLLAMGEAAHRRRDVDTQAWTQIVVEVAERERADDAPAWAKGLAARLQAMSPVERVAVLERIEAYGRSEGVR